MIECYSATELARLDNVTRQTVLSSKKYVKIIVRNYYYKRNKNGYSVKYARLSDIKKLYDLPADSQKNIKSGKISQ